MRVRYKNGKPIASVYFPEEHKIKLQSIDKDALKVITKLIDNGYETYLVGGAIRDILLGKVPKDFDVVTQATPRQVHKLFANSRIIGRRFRLVHVVFGEKIIEVSTFRSTAEHEEKSDNIYGTLEEDSSRRDFTINSLYYNPLDETLIDFNNSLNDFNNSKIHAVIPVSKIFKEDPVRMIRAIKYSVSTGFKLSGDIRRAIKRDASELIRVSSSRLTEEVIKILYSGNSSLIVGQLVKYKLLTFMLPCISIYAKYPALYQTLDVLDAKVREVKAKEETIQESQLFLGLVKPFIIPNTEIISPFENYKDIFRQIKVLISPITPPNYELENTAKLYMKEKGMVLPKQKPTAKR